MSRIGIRLTPMIGVVEKNPKSYRCMICGEEASGKSELLDHLRENHEMLEVLSYVASNMVSEQERDRDAKRSFMQFEQLRNEVGGMRRKCPLCGAVVSMKAKFCDQCQNSL